MLPATFAGKFSPPQPWQASEIAQLKSHWPFPEIARDVVNMVLPQVAQMGSLGLGFTSQYQQYTGPTGNPSQLPLISVTVKPASATVGNNGQRTVCRHGTSSGRNLAESNPGSRRHHLGVVDIGRDRLQ
jgi:hypothetical protein